MLHQLDFTYELNMLVPCHADAQADFLDELAVLEAHVERGESMLYYAAAAHPTRVIPALGAKWVRSAYCSRSTAANGGI